MIVVDYILIRDTVFEITLHAVFDCFDSVVISKLVSEPSVTSYQFLILSVVEFKPS